MVWHSNNQYRKTIWQCNHKFDNDAHCTTPHLTDEDIQNAFLSAANKLLSTKDEVIANGHEMVELLFDTSELEAEQATLLEETQLISDMVQLQQMQLQRADIEAFLQSFAELPDTLTKFKSENWHALVDYSTVHSADDIRSAFKHGQEIKA